MAAAVAAALAADSQAKLTLMHVYDSHHHPERQEREARIFRDLAEEVSAIKPELLEVVAPDPEAALLEVCAAYDAVVLGAHAAAGDPAALVGPSLASLLRALPKTVVLTRSM